MSRKSKALARARRASVSASSGGTIAQPQSIVFGSAFDGANWSERRGYIYTPTLDRKQEITPITRRELLRRARYLVNNVGFAKRCVWGLARMCGYLSPKPLTQDKEWNTLALSLWEQSYGASPMAFDAQGRQNVYSYQPLAIASRLQDGDFFSVFTESKEGRAMVMSYEAHQCHGTDFEVGIRDGIRTNALGRAISARIMNPDAQLMFALEPTDFTDIPFRNVVQHADFLSTNHERGVSALHHAITHLVDRTELIADLKTGAKIANRQAFFVTNTQPQLRTNAPTGMTVTQSGTNVPTLQTPTQWAMQDLYNYDRQGGKVVELGANQDVKQLLDQRPHPNTVEFLDYLCRDIAAGLDMPYECLWNIAKLGGASVRYVMADAQKAIERLQQLLVDQFLTRFWVYFISKEVAAGRLRPCEDPSWFMVGWQPQAKLTVDIGRDGRLSIDLHKSAMLSLNKWYGQQGDDWQHELTQQVEEYAFKVVTCQKASAQYGITITPDIVWPELAPSAPAPDIEPDAEFSEEPNVTPIDPTKLAA